VSDRGRGAWRDGLGPPILVRVVATLAVLLLLLPLAGLVVRAPWGAMLDVLGSPRVGAAIRLSLSASLAALALSTVLGVPLAIVLARGSAPWLRWVRALVLLPMVLPPVVGGVALLAAFGRRGLVGEPLARIAGITIPFTGVAVVLAATFVAMPFLVLAVEGGVRQLDGRLEEAAATLGASRSTILVRVVLPSLAPTLGAGMLLAWARALGEFGATITFAGNLPGRTQTLPLLVYLELERDPAAATLLSLVMLAVAVVVLASLRGRWLGGLRR
jgi:molybdate transport system permease protein